MTPTNVPAAAAGLAEKQAIRLRRYSLAAFTYLLTLVPLAGAYAFGFMALAPAVRVAAAIVALNALLFVTFRTGANLRFRDPSLTKPQLYLGITLLMYALFHLEAGRGLALSLCFVVFLFGVFRLATREFATLTLYTLAAYALVINLLFHWRPEAVDDVRLDWYSWLLLAATLPGFGVVGGKISALRERLRARNQDLEDAVATIHAMATRDEVTGLYNRVFFSESLRHALAQAERHRRGLAVLFIDADRFKLINDTLGHGAGDRVLREIGERAQACVRQSDLVARFGGDEFVVLIEDVRSPQAAADVAAKILAALGRPAVIDGRQLAVSVSIGIAVAPDDGRDPETLLRSADAAMYRAKARGRNGFAFHLKESDAAASERLALAAELGLAVQRGELRLFFQPRVRLTDGRITGLEALIRWQHPRHGLLAPDRFIAIAEETGAILEIGRWVLDTACARAVHWGASFPGLRMAVNLSPRQFSGSALLAEVRAALSATGMAAGLLELEITESMVMAEPEEAAGTMHRLRAMGVRLAMDDFGTGYSSLSYLKRFPMNVVKLDRSFVKDLPGRREDVAIARALLAMGRSLGMEVVAEGVERTDQLDFLRREGCHEFQGYLCSAPQPESAVPALLQTNCAPVAALA